MVLAVTTRELLLLRLGWGGWRVRGLLDRWNRDDIVATRIEEWSLLRASESFAISVENTRLGRRFDASAEPHSDEAARVIGLLVGA